jgi:hypothetical protein
MLDCGHRNDIRLDAITRVMSYPVATDTAAGRLKLLPGAYAPPAIRAQFVMQSFRSVTAKARAFIAFATEPLRKDLDRAAALLANPF